MHKIQKALTIIGLCLTAANTQAARITDLDGVMVTLNPAARISGPIFNYAKGNQKQYGDQLAKIIIKESHKKAKKYLDYGDTRAYYTFMMLGLTIPLHEGLLIHFREVANEDGVCRKRANKGKTLKNRTARKNFQKALVKGRNPFLLPCKKLKNQYSVRQMISGGGDNSDVGIMQLSSRWHYDNFLALGKYRSVKETVEYGLGHALVGFKKVYSNSKNYRCILKRNGAVDYEKLARGIWAGKYNSGNTGSTCRFADPGNKHPGKDRGFLENFTKTKNILLKGRFFGFDEEMRLGLNSKTRKALEQIVQNFLNESNNRDAIDSIL
jgi:hypothetical protein